MEECTRVRERGDGVGDERRRRRRRRREEDGIREK